MAVKTNKKEIPDSSTQRYLPFSGIRENVMLMKDNSARVILKCSTINFLLKSTDEQDAIIVSFQRFLNSLKFPIQIMVRSKKLDIETYLAKLTDKALVQKNSLLQKQTYDYIEYLRKLIEVAQIMKKEFYIVIPYDTDGDKSVKDTSFIGTFANFWKSINSAQDILSIKSQIKNFSKTKKELFSRANNVKDALNNIGIKGEVLEKKELIELLTDYYNPRLDNLNKLNNDISEYNLINNK